MLQPRVGRPCPGVIGIYLGGQFQGGYWEEPSVPDFGPYVPNSPYMLGWLGAASRCPSGDVVMVGLGSGAGAVSLLVNFPDLALTVIEIDPQMRQAAEDAFPYLGYFEDEGRLTVHVGDAAEVLGGSSDRWDLGLADAYTGDTYDCIEGFIPELIKRTARQAYNVIGAPGRGCLDRMIRTLPVRGAYTVDGLDGNLSNWILTSDDRAPAQGFAPFAGETARACQSSRALYAKLFSRNRLADLKSAAQ